MFMANNTAYLVMDFEDGLDLETLITGLTKNGQLYNQEQLLHFLIPLAEGFVYLHQQDILHRDIKPANIFIRREDGSPVIIDFGAAKQNFAMVSQSKAPFTEFYAPIEQIEGGRGAKPSMDIHAFGALMYRLVTGKVGVKAESRAMAIVYGKPDPLEPVSTIAGPSYSPKLLALIDHCLQFKPEQRPQSMQEVYDVLLAVARGDTEAERVAPVAPEPVWFDPIKAAVPDNVAEPMTQYHQPTPASKAQIDEAEAKARAKAEADAAKHAAAEAKANEKAQAEALKRAEAEAKANAKAEVKVEVAAGSEPQPAAEQHLQADAVPETLVDLIKQDPVWKWGSIAAAVLVVVGLGAWLLSGDDDPVKRPKVDKVVVKPDVDGKKTNGTEQPDGQQGDPVATEQQAEQQRQQLLATLTGATAAQQAFARANQAYFDKADYAAAVTAYQQALDAGSALAQAQLAVMQAQGQGMPSDAAVARTSALTLLSGLTEVAAFNDEVALYLALLQRYVLSDYSNAFDTLQRLADAGNAQAQWEIALRYRDGLDTTANINTAMSWLISAADQQHSAALFTLGTWYESGTSVAKNLTEAARYMKLAGDQMWR
jgi:hypothetical protein